MAAWVLAASPSGAATVSEVRVGTHDDGHTRIVVELDSMAGYRLQSPTGGGAPELVVDLDASSIQRDVPSKSRVVKKVHVEPNGSSSTVRISLATGDVAVKEMLLSNPPRIVFDLKARGPLPKTAEVADAADVEPEKSEAPAEPEKVAVTPPPIAPAPAPAKAEPPAPAPVPVAAAEPAAPKSSPPPADRPVAPPASSKLTLPGSPAAAQTAEVAPPPSAPRPDLEPSPPAASNPPAAEPAAKPVLIPPVEREKHIASPAAPSAPPTSTVAEARRDAIAAKAKQSASPEGSLVDLAMSPLGMGAIGAVVLLLLAVVVMRRRRAAEDEDPLYTVMSAEDAGAGVSMDAAYPATEAESRPPVLSSLGPYDSETYEEASEPVFKSDATGRQLTLGSVGVAAAASPAPAEAADDASDSLFAAAEPEVAEAPAAAAPVHASIDVPAAASQVAQVSAEVERRIAELERRLEQLTEARERLERQVAAQTEELRVQRAAIARTQRVVRTIAKTEDMATEPVPRAPSA